MLNGGGWGTQVGMAALVRGRGYLLEEKRSPDHRQGPRRRRAGRASVWASRLAAAGIALFARLAPRG
jgi:hypothetical protein